MIQLPLNVIPTWIVQILQVSASYFGRYRFPLTVLQTGVALKRIAVYLDEEEVDEQVSSIKKVRNAESRRPGSGEETVSGYKSGLGIVGGSFKWNAVEEKVDDVKGKKADRPGGGASEATSATVEGTDAATVTGQVEGAEEGESLLAADADHRFELRDISVMFPEGELTLVTGPTASGKTALLVGF